MFSIVVVYNNVQILNNLILKSLEKQTFKYELILIDNRNNTYNSAAKALNIGCRKATNKYIMCVHQDVELYNSDFLEKAESILDSLEDVGIAGVAGMSTVGLSHEEKRRNIIYQGYPEKDSWGNKIEQPEDVQTLDECLMIIPLKIFNVVSFDEYSCSDWHLYGVDYCLTIKELGLKAYILPLPIYHRSKGESAIPSDSFFKLGSKTPGYYLSLNKVLKKHKKYFKEIYTTCGNWHTKYPIFLQRSFHYFKFRLLKIITNNF